MKSDSITRLSILSLTIVGGILVAASSCESQPAQSEAPGNTDDDRRGVIADLVDRVKELEGENKRLKETIKAINERADRVDKVLADNKASVGTELANLKRYFTDQNLRVEWRYIKSVPISPDLGSEYTVDFEKPIEDAVAIISRCHLTFPNGHHNIRQVLAAAAVTKIDGTKVTVQYHAFMNDNDGNRSKEHGISFVILARIKSN